MPIVYCPRCNQRVSTSNMNTDIIHECNSGVPALDQEDILKVGNWDDYTGTGTESNVKAGAGLASKNIGERSFIDGERVKTLTERGETASTHRVRQHLEFIDLKKKNGQGKNN